MSKILVVEDHDNLRSSLKSCLETEGFEVLTAASADEARAKFSEAPNLIVMDWMLPDGQGIDLVKELRQLKNQTPIIFLTARADIFDKVLGLELGANDYMTKPFEPRELIARVRLRLREAGLRTAQTDESKTTLKVGSLCIDRIKHKVSFQDREIDLVKKEFDLLLMFAENPEKVFSRDELLNKVWGYDVYPTTRTVDTHVMLLRQKVDDAMIETVRAVGYRFKPV